MKRTVSANKAAPTLRVAIDAYISNRENTLSPSTIDGYRRIQKNRFQSVMDKRLNEIGNWQSVCDQEARLCAPKTLKNAYRFIVSVLSENSVAAPRVSLPVMTSEPKKWLEPEQITRLVATAAGTDSALPVLLALSSLRRSEIMGLDWRNVNLPAKTITVRGAVVPSVNGFVSKRSNKNETSARSVPIMMPELMEALSSVPEHDRSGRVVQCSAGTLCNRINRACRAAGVPEVGTHGLRHSFASLAYHLGMSELETMEIGGWADTQTMHKIYTHLAAADRLTAENKMTEFYKSANKNAN